MDRRRFLTSLAGAVALTGVPSLIPSAFGDAADDFRFAAPGNAVIVTSAGLIDVDPGLPCVGELAHRLNHALREPKVLIISPERNHDILRSGASR
jgi:hypothetical protein